MVRHIEANAHLLVSGFACALIAHDEICRVHLKDVVAIGRAVALIANSDAAFIERTTPPRAGDGCQYMVVERARAVEAVFLAEVEVVVRMGVTGDGI